MSDLDPMCAICGAAIGRDYLSEYLPYPSHADKRICNRIIRADEARRIAIGVTDLPDALTGEKDSRTIPTVVDTESVFAVIGHGWEQP